MTDIMLIDNTASFEGVKDFLSLCGVDISTFDTSQDGHKTLEELYEELRERELTLFFDKNIRKVVQFRLSSKLLIQTQQEELLEVERIYHPHEPVRRTVLTDRKDYSLSESRKRNETAEEAVLRGLREELDGYEIPSGKFLRPLSIGEEAQPYRPSRVYPGIISRVVLSRFALDLEEKIFPEGRMIPDHGAEIYIQWFLKT